MLESCGDPDTVAISSAGESDIVALHNRCGVYTNRATVARILDAIGWIEDSDLSDRRLLEPAAGDGAFVFEAARRLMGSLARSKTKPTVKLLAPRIRSFELCGMEARACRERVFKLLVSEGLAPDAADEVGAAWVIEGDFLAADLRNNEFTHVAGNPPYVRWSKIPSSLRRVYEAKLSRDVAKGDLFLPFLDRGIELLAVGGRLGFVCSNRWEYMGFARDFRRTRLPCVNILLNSPIEASQAYQRAVDAYPSLLVLERRGLLRRAAGIKPAGKTLAEAGYRIRVGPALGCTTAFVLGPDESDVEPEILAPWLSAAEILQGKICSTGKRVICLHDDHGRLRDLADFPRAHARLLRFREQLQSRSIVSAQGAPWYRPIDRVLAAVWRGPKVLVPELSKVPRMAVDRTGAIPGHGVYAIIPDARGADIDQLVAALGEGKLAKLLEGHAPKVKGGYVRCYKDILNKIRI